MSKEFKTIDDLLTDKLFIKNVAQVLDEQQTARANRPQKEGLRYRRNGIDELEETGNFTVDFFLEEFGAVLAKVSNQSKRVREIVSYVGGIALHRTREQYRLLAEAENKPKSKTIGQRKVNRKDPK